MGDGGGLLNNITFLKTCDSGNVYLLTPISIVPDIDLECGIRRQRVKEWGKKIQTLPIIRFRTRYAVCHLSIETSTR